MKPAATAVPDFSSRSRGIDNDTARKMLVYSFGREVTQVPPSLTFVTALAPACMHANVVVALGAANW